MSQLNYISYRDECIRLARSIVIKSSHTADIINNSLMVKGVTVVLERPETWKYYLNMAGIYHTVDRKMYVRSMDTLETIEFTRENLEIHRATAREYKYGTIHYTNLTNKYPELVDLINGIIAPIDIQTSINSNNGDILYYDPTLVESNEDNFIAELQAWIDRYWLRWMNPQFLISDNLYLQYFIGSLSLNLPAAIELIRLRNCHTHRAHTFHIREHLASNGQLDRYMPYLTKRQQLWLYRNIRFIMRNSGKQEIFNRLVDKILTPRNIPLIEYSLNQNSSVMPDEIYPDVELVKNDINLMSVTPGNDKSSVALLLEREIPLARDNAGVLFDAEQEIVESTKISGFSELPTKVLDSEVIDHSSAYIRSLKNVLLNQWFFLASSGRYRAYIHVPNPKTGEYMSITVKDALIITIYCLSKIHGYNLENIPALTALEVQRIPLPDFNELRALSPPRLIADQFIRDVMDTMTPMGEYISTERFYMDCDTLHKAYIKQWRMYSAVEHHKARGYAENTVRANYMHINCPLTETLTSFNRFFEERQLEVTDLDEIELQQLMLDCVNMATGANLVTVITLGEVQRELLALMSQLCSYPLQFMRNVAYSEFTNLGLISTRLGDQTVETEGNTRLIVDNWNVTHADSSQTAKYQLGMDEIDPDFVVKLNTSSRYHYDPCVTIKERYNTFGHYRLNTSALGIKNFKMTFDNEYITDGVMDQYQTPSN